MEKLDENVSMTGKGMTETAKDMLSEFWKSSDEIRAASDVGFVFPENLLAGSVPPNAEWIAPFGGSANVEGVALFSEIYNIRTLVGHFTCSGSLKKPLPPQPGQGSISREGSGSPQHS